MFLFEEDIWMPVSHQFDIDLADPGDQGRCRLWELCKIP